MSYILDALKKSEQERREQEERQNLVYTPLSTNRSPRFRRRLAPGLILSSFLLLFLLILGGGWWYLNNTEVIDEQVAAHSPQPTDEEKVKTERVEAPPAPVLTDSSDERAEESLTQSSPAPPTTTPVTENVTQQPDQVVDQPAEEALRPSPLTKSAPENVAQQADQAADQSAEEELRPSPAATPEPESLPLLADLPFSTRSMLPEMQLRGHVYSETPSQRMIMINTSIAREGDTVAPDLSLIEITEDGLILRFRDTRFRIEMF
jgi:general secretion pathway protein B